MLNTKYTGLKDLCSDTDQNPFGKGTTKWEAYLWKMLNYCADSNPVANMDLLSLAAMHLEEPSSRPIAILMQEGGNVIINLLWGLRSMNIPQGNHERA